MTHQRPLSNLLHIPESPWLGSRHVSPWYKEQPSSARGLGRLKRLSAVSSQMQAWLTLQAAGTTGLCTRESYSTCTAFKTDYIPHRATNTPNMQAVSATSMSVS